MEMSHRGAVYADIAKRCQDDIKTFLQIPENFSVLLCQGGATAQYAAAIKNLMKYDDNGKPLGVSYLTTGHWSKQCVNQARNMLKDDEVNEMETVYNYG